MWRRDPLERAGSAAAAAAAALERLFQRPTETRLLELRPALAVLRSPLDTSRRAARALSEFADQAELAGQEIIRFAPASADPALGACAGSLAEAARGLRAAIRAAARRDREGRDRALALAKAAAARAGAQRRRARAGAWEDPRVVQSLKTSALSERLAQAAEALHAACDALAEEAVDDE